VKSEHQNRHRKRIDDRILTRDRAKKSPGLNVYVLSKCPGNAFSSALDLNYLYHILS
jgi:hypothetical protein